MAELSNADRVRKIIASHLNKESVKDSDTLLDLGADSLDFVELVLEFEEEFQIEIRDEDAEREHNDSRTVANVVALVEETITREKK